MLPVHKLLTEGIVFLLLLHSTCLLESLLLLLQHFLANPFDTRIISTRLELSFGLLILLDIIFDFSISHFVFKTFRYNLLFLLFQVSPVLLLQVLGSDLVFLFDGSVHFILVLDDGSPLVVDHLFGGNG